MLISCFPASSLFSFIKFRTTLAEELEDIHHETGRVHQSLTETRLRQRQWTKLFFIYAILAYAAINLVYYAYFLPSDYLPRLYSVAFSVLMAGLIYGLHWVVCWYFRTSIQAKEERIQLFKERKRELLDMVKEREPYNVAQELLRRFDGDNISSTTPAARSASVDKGDVRQRVTVSKPNTQTPNQGQSAQQQSSQIPVTVQQQSPSIPTSGNVTPGKLPRAILPPQRTVWGMLLDTIVGDGPSKRYALVCKNCYSHNGMALEEEFEYLPFRCAYCNCFNPAKKQKPVFHGDISAHDEPQQVVNPSNISAQQRQSSTTADNSVQQMDVSHSESDSDDTALKPRRSIRVPEVSSSVAHSNNNNDNNNIQKHNSRSSSRENIQRPMLSSSDESLSGSGGTNYIATERK
ncbi:unnamed protein product [Didymodactylos carnosus]|uniref:Endoplasmic reticulum junction formation protein lunapark n=1 Tax=Didymodactylos carnosus TaxID=1234261 RepID=A0A813NRZ6_9BILA|nr:unnamed protein product [Didymodactylos carnosus]CAF0778697.1 unnamed protein product [Didymodactylos carnosus]CAF3517765.1 unnamed protein product [Didymodactylos carnosus]CAF3560089.1 unnamed protein product [Didymodactylos carnosus]